MLRAALNAFNVPDLRRKILFTLGLLVVFRIAAHVPVPNVDHTALTSVLNNNNLLQMLNIFSGGSLQNFSIVAMGVYPVHHGVDRHAAPGSDHSPHGRALQRRRIRPEQDQPVHPPADHPAGAHPGLRPDARLEQLQQRQGVQQLSVCSAARPFSRPSLCWSR